MSVRKLTFISGPSLCTRCPCRQSRLPKRSSTIFIWKNTGSCHPRPPLPTSSWLHLCRRRWTSGRTRNLLQPNVTRWWIFQVHRRVRIIKRGKASHTAIDCYHRMDYAYQGKHPPTKLTTMVTSSNHLLTQEQPWLADSAATDHVTASLNQLSFPKPY